MICTICYAVKNTNKWYGELVEITLLDDRAVCYRCYAEAKAVA